MKRKPNIKQKLPSGNQVEIYFPSSIQTGELSEIAIEWETFPPSNKDIQDYQRVVQTRIVEEANRRFNLEQSCSKN
jgi:hypothetical protein